MVVPSEQYIFMTPFYYIDYTLAQVCIVLVSLYQKDENAFEDHYRITQIEERRHSRKSRVAAANLKVPFADGCLKDVMKAVAAIWIRWMTKHFDAGNGKLHILEMACRQR